MRQNALGSWTFGPARSENRMLFAEKHRAIRQVAEARFVFSQDSIDLLAFRSAQRLNEVLGFIPPYLGQAIIRRLGVAWLLGGRVQGSVQRVALHIPFGP